jgi:hypothetical protein
MNKICSKCKEEKSIKQFYKYKSDYILPYCITCKNEKTKKWKDRNREHLREYKKEYDKEHRKEIREYCFHWRKKTKGYIAHSKIQRALRKGKILKPDRCCSCKRIRKLYAHHQDYNKPFKIKWICARCHMDIHKGGK